MPAPPEATPGARPSTQEQQPVDREKVKEILQGNIGKAEKFFADYSVAREKDKVRGAVRENDKVILEAATGSGKSVVAPITILHELLERNPDARMIVTQPKRLATKSISEFVGSKIGSDYVDYHYRRHPANKKDARLIYTVEQSLIKMVRDDPMLEKFDAVLLDEVHERNISTDLLIPALIKAQELRRKNGKLDLKIVLASGTLDDPALVDFVNQGDKPAHRLKIEGRAYPIEETFSDRHIPLKEIATEAAKETKKYFDDKDKTGDVLIFMPGGRDIDQTKEAIEALLPDQDVDIIIVKGGGSDPYKDINAPRTKRRIYIATNAAETSITFPGQLKVISSGYMKKNIYNKVTRIKTLETIPITQANWGQQKGRAGRTEAGEAHALFTKADLEARPTKQVAGILQADLIPEILELAAGLDGLESVNFIERPEREVINQAIESLQKMGALDKAGHLTSIGEQMVDMDEEPRFARMLIEADKRGCLPAVALLIAAMKEDQSIFALDSRDKNVMKNYGQYVDPNSDFITLIRAWNDYVAGKREGFSEEGIAAIKRERNNLRVSSSSDNAPIPIDTEEQMQAINLSIAAGLTDRVIVRQPNGYKISNGASSGIEIGQTSAITGPELLSGKIKSSKQGERNTKNYSQMNMIYDEDLLRREFAYLNDVLPGKPVTEAPKDTQREAPVQNQDDNLPQAEAAIVREIDQLEKKVSVEPTPETKEEVETFVKRIRKTFSRFSEGVKKPFLAFGRLVQRILGIK